MNDLSLENQFIDRTFIQKNKYFTNNLNLCVAYRILSILQNRGPEIKTELAKFAGLNYNTCVKYLQTMKTLGWIEID